MYVRKTKIRSSPWSDRVTMMTDVYSITNDTHVCSVALLKEVLVSINRRCCSLVSHTVYDLYVFVKMHQRIFVG